MPTFLIKYQNTKEKPSVYLHTRRKKKNDLLYVHHNDSHCYMFILSISLLYVYMYYFPPSALSISGKIPRNITTHSVSHDPIAFFTHNVGEMDLYLCKQLGSRPAAELLGGWPGTQTVCQSIYNYPPKQT